METNDLSLPANWYEPKDAEKLAYELTHKGLPRLADLVSELMFRVIELESELEETARELDDYKRWDEDHDKEKKALEGQIATLERLLEDAKILKAKKTPKKGKTA